MCENHLGRQEPTGCRYIYGDPQTETWHFCQRTIADGGRPGDPNKPPYCVRHKRVTLMATSEAQRRNFLKFMERLAEGDTGWAFGLNGAPLSQASHLAAETDNLVPVDVRLHLANKGLSHD